MNVVGLSTKSLVNVKEEEVFKHESFKNIYLYDEAPIVEMSLDQFEVYALKRLKVCARQTFYRVFVLFHLLLVGIISWQP